MHRILDKIADKLTIIALVATILLTPQSDKTYVMIAIIGFRLMYYLLRQVDQMTEDNT